MVEANYRHCPLERCYILQSLPSWRWFSLIGDNGLSAVLYLCKIENYLCEIKKYLCKIENYLSKINPFLCLIFSCWSVVKIFEPPKMQYFWRRESWKLKVLKDGYNGRCNFCKKVKRLDRFWGWRNWRQFTNIIISYQKQHFNIWPNILQLLDNHIIASFLLYAAYKNVFFISSFSSFSVSYPSVPSVFWRVSFIIFFLQIYVEFDAWLPLEIYCKTTVDTNVLRSILHL